MIHYHGLPVTPDTCAVRVARGGHVFVSYRRPEQLGVAASEAQSFAIDNGAFSAWRAGTPVSDWGGYYAWAENCKRMPNCDFAVVPDVIDGTEEDNDALLREWPLAKWFGAPVWHMHESLERLDRLVHEWPRVCLGSSGDYSRPGNAAWWGRMAAAMSVACDSTGLPRAKLHGLRMLNPKVFSLLPLASADSTNVGRNIGIDSAWRGSYPPPTKESRVDVLRARIESANGARRWDFVKVAIEVFA